MSLKEILQDFAAAADVVFRNAWPMFDRFVYTPLILGLPSKESMTANSYAHFIKRDEQKILDAYKGFLATAESPDQAERKKAKTYYDTLSHSLHSYAIIRAHEANMAKPVAWNRVKHQTRPSTVFDRGEVDIKKIGELGRKLFSRDIDEVVAALGSNNADTGNIRHISHCYDYTFANYASACGHAGVADDTVRLREKFDVAIKQAHLRHAQAELAKVAEKGVPYLHQGNDKGGKQIHSNLVICNIIAAFREAGKISASTLAEAGLYPGKIMSNGYADFGLTPETVQGAAQRLQAAVAKTASGSATPAQG